MYSVICISQYRFRKRYIAEGGKLENLPYKTPLFPLVPVLGVLSFLAMLVATLTDPGEVKGIVVCAIMYTAIYIGARIYVKKKGGEAVNIDL